MERNHAIDLLKISSMVMVVFLHAMSYGVSEMVIEPLGMVDLMVSGIQSFSLVAVNCFVLIFGYYSSQRVAANYNRLRSLWIQVFFYSVATYLVITAFSGDVIFETKTLIRKALPLLTNQYWFFTVYAVLFLIAPYMNKLCNSLSKREYQRLLVLLLIVFSFIPSINVFGDQFGTEYGYSLIWFAVLYFAAAYARKYPPRRRAYGLYYVGLSCIVLICRLLMQFINIKGYPGIFAVLLNLQRQYNSPIVVAASLSLFMCAVHSKYTFARFGRMITSGATLSFAVYLLHEHSTVRDLLWKELVCLEKAGSNGILFVIRVFVSVILIFTFSITVEWVRIRVFQGMKKLVLQRK